LVHDIKHQAQSLSQQQGQRILSIRSIYANATAIAFPTTLVRYQPSCSILILTSHHHTSHPINLTTPVLGSDITAAIVAVDIAASILGFNIHAAIGRMHIAAPIFGMYVPTPVA
jgi:hypothetical protein